MKNYNESMLESMSNGLITLDENERIATCNAAGLRILKVHAGDILHKPVSEFFAGDNVWVLEKLGQVAESGQQQTSMDASLQVADESLSVNLTVQPLLDAEQKHIGSMFVIEDISSEKRIKSTMSRYMDPGIADRLVAAGAEVLGGKNVECTVLFSDIRDFTTLTEQLGAQGTVALLNEYFTLMVDCIQKEYGMLDKFIGDAIMAAFGIPESHEDDADRAVRAAIDMIKTLETWNRQRIGEGKLPVNIGIGLNTDNVVSGNIGSNKRMDFTIIGDGVNLASRMESACKQYGTKILASEFTVSKLMGTYRKREIDLVVVKGKTEPVSIYEILAFHTKDSFPGIGEVMGLFKDGLDAYRARKWDASIRLFGECLAINPNDKPSQLYIGRAEHLKANPPPDDWSGVCIMDTK
jgi:adenylate cyclase